MSVSIISWLDWCMWVDLQLIRPFVMWVLCAFCDLCVSNQESWKITHPCVQLAKHNKKNFERKHHTSLKAVHSRSTDWNAIHWTKTGQGSANQLGTNKKRLPWPYYVQRLVTNGQANNLCSVSLLKSFIQNPITAYTWVHEVHCVYLLHQAVHPWQLHWIPKCVGKAQKWSSQCLFTFSSALWVESESPDVKEESNPAILSN